MLVLSVIRGDDISVNTRNLIKKFIPPIVIDGIRRARTRRPQWEYMPGGWDSVDQKITGWDIQSIADAEMRKWEAFSGLLEGSGILGINHEDLHPTTTNPTAHNAVMSFGYVLGLAAAGRDRLSILDWGGGLGHYYLFAKTLLPEIQLEYHCRDLPPYCRYGRDLLPAVTFHDNDDRWPQMKFDLVFSSSAMQYVRGWQGQLAQLSSAFSRYMFITRIPMAQTTPSFVVLQRPYDLEYSAEYLGWVFNQTEFLQAARSQGVQLAREFLVMEDPVILNAPEQPHYRGFLFNR